MVIVLIDELSSLVDRPHKPSSRQSGRGYYLLLKLIGVNISSILNDHSIENLTRFLISSQVYHQKDKCNAHLKRKLSSQQCLLSVLPCVNTLRFAAFFCVSLDEIIKGEEVMHPVCFDVTMYSFFFCFFFENVCLPPWPTERSISIQNIPFMLGE